MRLLPAQGDRHSVPAEPWQPLCPERGTHRCRYCLDAGPVSLVGPDVYRYTCSREALSEKCRVAVTNTYHAHKGEKADEYTHIGNGAVDLTKIHRAGHGRAIPDPPG